MLTYHILLQQRVQIVLEDNSDLCLSSFVELSPEESEDVLFKEVQNHKLFLALSWAFPSFDPGLLFLFVSFSVLLCIFWIDWRCFPQLNVGLSLISML